MKTGATFSFTLNLGNFQSAKMEMTLTDIDTELDLNEQLRAASPYLDGVMNALEERLYSKMRESGLVKLVAEREVKK